MEQIFGGLGPGLGGNINPFDPNWNFEQLKASNQRIADQENEANIKKYTERAHQMKEANVQQQANHLPLLSLDPPPHKRVVDPRTAQIQDSPDLVCAPISVVPPPPTPDKAGGTGMVIAVPIPDRLDWIVAALHKLNADIEAIKAKLVIS